MTHDSNYKLKTFELDPLRKLVHSHSLPSLGHGHAQSCAQWRNEETYLCHAPPNSNKTASRGTDRGTSVLYERLRGVSNELKIIIQCTRAPFSSSHLCKLRNNASDSKAVIVSHSQFAKSFDCEVLEPRSDEKSNDDQKIFQKNVFSS